MLRRFSNVYVVIDRNRLLGGKNTKASPCDKGREVFEQLLKEKVKKHCASPPFLFLRNIIRQPAHRRWPTPAATQRHTIRHGREHLYAQSVRHRLFSAGCREHRRR